MTAAPELSADERARVAAFVAAPQLAESSPIVRAVLALHRPMVNSPGGEPACPDCLGGIYLDDPLGPRSCGCWGLSTPACSSCADHHGGRRFAQQWPCPTARDPRRCPGRRPRTARGGRGADGAGDLGRRWHA